MGNPAYGKGYERGYNDAMEKMKRETNKNKGGCAVVLLLGIGGILNALIYSFT